MGEKSQEHLMMTIIRHVLAIDGQWTLHYNHFKVIDHARKRRRYFVGKKMRHKTYVPIATPTYSGPGNPAYTCT